MIRLRNGHHLDYVVASGALAFDGRGWPWEWPLRWLNLIDPACFTVVTKTITAAPRVGNLRTYAPWQCVRLLPEGAVNAVGLTNPGLDWWCRTVGPRVGNLRWPLMASLLSNDPAELAMMVRAVSRFPLVGIELNLSCPNTRDAGLHAVEDLLRLIEAAAGATQLPLIAKVGVTHNVELLVPPLVGLVDALAINTVPWAIRYPDAPSPLANLGGGGVSGKPARQIIWPFVKQLAELSSVPVIGPGMWNMEDGGTLYALGAKALSFGTLFLRHPTRPTAIVRQLTAL